jgi:two-component system, LuxR family, sensor kinase FixL
MARLDLNQIAARIAGGAIGAPPSRSPQPEALHAVPMNGSPDSQRAPLDRRALAAATVGTWSWERASDLLVWSPEACALFGLKEAGSLTRDRILALIHPEDRPDAAAMFERERHDRVFDRDIRAIWPDGSEHWLRVKGTGIADPNGRLERIVGIVVGIEARKQIELAASQLASIVESSEDAIIGTTLDGIVMSWNQAAVRIFGYRAEEMLGRPISILAVPSRADEMPRMLERIKAGERIAHYETERRRKDGRIIPVSLTVSPIRDETGRIVGASKIARDIGPVKRAEAELRQGEAHLQSILDTVPDAMIIIDERGIIQSFSATAERLFGFTAEEACGRNVNMLMPTPHRENHDGYLVRYLTTGERRIIGVGRVVAGQRRDGSTFPMELSVGEVRGREHRLFTGFVRDLSERQRTEQRVQELQSELFHISRVTEMGQMASGLAHELNQPLTAAANYLQAARRLLERKDDASFETAKGAIDSAAEQVTRAGQIIRRARESVKKADTAQETVDVLKLVEEASALALIGAKEHGVAVRFRTAPGLHVLIDKIQIQQVLVNLVRNAVEAMAASSRRELTIETAPADTKMIHIGVIDTGPGIAQEIADRLFQPFVTTKAQGMGVGLSICRSIVEAHGGRLWTEPNPEGGTIFRFTLPTAR